MKMIFQSMFLVFAILLSPAFGQMQVGMNLAVPSDWGRAWVWKDQMRQARWLAGNNNWWLIQWNHDKYPPGRWVAEWTGDDAPKFVRGVGTIDEILPGLAAVEINPVKGIAIQPFGDVKDIRLWMPGVNRSGSPFHPEYVRSLAPFKVLRFMDWGSTNTSIVSDWAQRRFPGEQAQWVAKDNQGVAVEHMIDLANEVGADPWLCIPHLATDDYVLQLANLLDRRLKSGRVVYLEWGNEICWNGAYGFNGGAWLQTKGKAEGFRPVDYYGGRVKKINEIARPILGSRLKLVVAGQANNPWIAQQEAKAAGRGAFDCVSCTWYFGLPKGFVGTADHTVSDILDLCEADINGRMLDRLVAHKKTADLYGVPLVLYEGGQHLSVAATSPIATEVLTAQRHPRMGDLYRLALERCREAGVTLAVAYNDVLPWSSSSSWGGREHMTDYTSPKWTALTEEAAK